jgi:hypothetical protein
MAKMFYTLEQTAQKLGLGEDEIKELAKEGKIQQFRDRDKLMFKRDQIDGLMTTKEDSAGQMEVPQEATELPTEPRGSRQPTGVDVFETDEVEAADPAAQTEVTEPTVTDEEDLSLESVGSGSGLLDLTQESDDTSLGAELLDEIYPDDEPADSKTLESDDSGSLFPEEEEEPAGTVSGIESVVPAAAEPEAVMVPAEEAYDPEGNGLTIGLLIGASVGLVVALIVAVSAITGVSLTLTTMLTKNSSVLGMYSGGLLVASVLLGLIGFAIGRRRG